MVPPRIHQTVWWLSEVLRMKVTWSACLKSLWDIIKSFRYDLLCLEIYMLLLILQLVGQQHLEPILPYYPFDPVHIVEDLGVEAVTFGTADTPRNNTGSHPATAFCV